jgi:hypothetical protein
MQTHAFAVVLKNVESDEERLNLKFHNENVAITQMAAYVDPATSKVVLAMQTPLGGVDLEITPAFAREVITALQKAQ